MAKNKNDDDLDLRLLTAWRQGDQSAGQQLVERHFGVVFRFCQSKVPSASIKDLVQTTMLELVKSEHRYEGRGSFRSFLLAIAYNVLRHDLRSRRRDRLDFDGDEVSCCDLGLGPLDVLVFNEDKQLLITALRRIPLNFQIVLELSFWEEMSSREVGEVLGEPSPTVRSRILRAYELLKKQIRILAKDDERAERTMTGFVTWSDEIREILGPRRQTGENDDEDDDDGDDS